MSRQKHTREGLILQLKNLAVRLGQTSLSKKDIAGIIPESVLTYHFGSLGNALEEAGLERRSGKRFRKGENTISDEDLFVSLHELEGVLECEPGYNAYSAKGRYSNRPFRTRFGKWENVLQHYRKWKAENAQQADASGGCEEMLVGRSPNHDLSGQNAAGTHANREPLNSIEPMRAAAGASSMQLYGEPINFRGLRHAPINEQGVVFLFGMISGELGFSVEAIQQGFPDCEAKYLHDKRKGLWAKARIEFEFRSSNFEGDHDPSQCDYIVCWIHDWRECPSNLRVIELKTEILKLPATPQLNFPNIV